jgi:aryl-alcohol dehydrogenase-like predicted oxidoreductase
MMVDAAAPTAEEGVAPAAAPAPKPTMIMRPLGESGIEVSAIALGCFAFGGDKKTGTHLGAQMTALHNGVWGDQDDADTFATVKAALDLGTTRR